MALCVESPLMAAKIWATIRLSRNGDEACDFRRNWKVNYTAMG